MEKEDRVIFPSTYDYNLTNPTLPNLLNVEYLTFDKNEADKIFVDTNSAVRNFIPKDFLTK